MKEKEPTVFDLALRDCVEETVREVLGKGVSKAFMRHVYGRLDSTVDAVPDRETALFNALRNLFGVGGDTIGRRIVRKLYAKAKVPFIDTPRKAPVDYVKELRGQFPAK